MLLVSLAALAFYERGGASALSRKIVSSILFPVRSILARRRFLTHPAWGLRTGSCGSHSTTLRLHILLVV